MADRDGCVLWLEEDWAGVSEEGRQRYVYRKMAERCMCVVVRGRLVGVSEEGRQRYKGRWRKDGCVLWIEEDWWG